MSASQMADLYKTVQKSLRAGIYGRGSSHRMGACARCNMLVCLSHHSHTEGR